MIIDFSLILKSIPYVLSGLPYTLGISLLSFMVGNVFAIILAFMRMSQKPWLKYPARIYISIMRGVPMLVVLFILYFGLPYVGVQLPALLCAFIGFSCVSAAYMAEIFRSSIVAVDKGQWEAARSLGLPQKSIIRRIILPQAMRIAVAPLGNVIIDMDYRWAWVWLHVYVYPNRPYLLDFELYFRTAWRLSWKTFSYLLIFEKIVWISNKILKFI